MTMTHPAFTPTAAEPASLEAITVGRDDLLDQLLDRLRLAGSTGTRAHTLLIGPRGSGKTHLLTLALQRAKADPEIAERLAVAWVPEDALAIGSYTDLLVELILRLEPDFIAEARGVRRSGSNHDLEKLLHKAAAGRTLVLVIENLDRVFTALGTTGASGLRGFVETDDLLVFASAPLQFAAVQRREEPWFGAFNVEIIPDLTLADGTEIMRRRALAREDSQLADFVVSPTGQARLEVIETLAGGSPRLWHILADAVDVASLDQLMPAVEKLLDDLAPYYQQRLWELPASEQKLIVELARQDGMQPVTELASAVGSSDRAVAVSLGRLVEARWVRKQKASGGDQRKTWYGLREPLLRHHLQYRENRGEPLRLIVELLRHWYDDRDRETALLRADLGSRSEHTLALTFSEGTPRRFDTAWADRDVEKLTLEARRWRLGIGNTAVAGSKKLGAALEYAGLFVQQEEMKTQLFDVPVELRELINGALEEPRNGAQPADRLEVALGRIAGADWPEPDRSISALVAICWAGHSDPQSAAPQLETLIQQSPDDEETFRLAMRNERAFWTGAAGDPAAARDLFGGLVEDLIRVLGTEHPDTFISRLNEAGSTGESGNPAAARDLFTVLIEDSIRVRGTDHPTTLSTRHSHAYWTGKAGDPSGARDLFLDLVEDRTRILGPNHADTLSSRHNHAYWGGEAGDDPDGVRNLFAAVVGDRTRMLGPDRTETLRSRHNYAYWIGVAGDPAAARDLSIIVAKDARQLLGKEHPITRAAGSLQARFDRIVELSRRFEPSTALQLRPAKESQRLGFLMDQLAKSSTEARVAWLREYGDEPETPESWVWNAAHALDGDPESMLRLSPELREIVQSVLDHERGP